MDEPEYVPRPKGCNPEWCPYDDKCPITCSGIQQLVQKKDIVELLLEHADESSLYKDAADEITKLRSDNQ